ncbi:hypothetical protein N657DRAFT_648063 [Parathielavia appendiculata]|uniref:Uncharacterized protein n=1 Tax=Parathielavia appendiculata TaxID=2587402 RepID=A0AAN6TVG4_9PEZI|nr:hypothetical protein N657DRAFT_648063 [Parathielavia appendiculata]
MGWLAILLFWAQAMLLTADATQLSGIPFGSALLVSPNFWMLVVVTLLVVYPWTRLRLRDVEAEVLSPHCVKLSFRYRNVHYGQAIRLTDAPLKETHAFGVIPFPSASPSTPTSHCPGCTCHTTTKPTPSLDDDKTRTDTNNNLSLATIKHHALTTPPRPPFSSQQQEPGGKGFSVLVSNAGDWTRNLIARPPRKIYTRGTPQFGVMRVAGLFSPCVVVATGSGIAPCLSLFVQRPNHPVRIIWSAKDPVTTYGRDVVELVYRTDPEAVVIDTGVKGMGHSGTRPDLVRLAYRVWEQGRVVGDGGESRGERKKGEAVVVISNQKVTKKVVYGLECRGVPAYGAIFDS